MFQNYYFLKQCFEYFESQNIQNNNFFWIQLKTIIILWNFSKVVNMDSRKIIFSLNLAQLVGTLNYIYIYVGAE
jgi:hypothetical protein